MRTHLAVATMVGLLALAAAGVAQEAPAGSAVTVWVGGDGVRVNPETGRYFEGRTDIHKDYPTGDYQKRNAVWDADKARVTLHAARDEFVSFQVVVSKAEPIKAVIGWHPQAQLGGGKRAGARATPATRPANVRSSPGGG